jgi:hypothetical protein
MHTLTASFTRWNHFNSEKHLVCLNMEFQFLKRKHLKGSVSFGKKMLTHYQFIKNFDFPRFGTT